MTTIYQEQPRVANDDGMGLVAGLVLALAVIALVFLVTRATQVQMIDRTPNAGLQVEGNANLSGSSNNTGTSEPGGGM